jgi:hypothetical protein
MKSEEKILTKHPEGKSGRNISRETYDLFKATMESVLRGNELTHTELMGQLKKKLTRKFSGNVNWYAETVKLDLEARKVLERTPSKPQRYRLR